jgi:stearoyl-CoA desaturase (Delta-9 desaturase)
LLTHRSFKAGGAVRGTLAVLGSAAIEGPAISWVADHRKHHAFSDRLGDPHSPHVDHGVGLSGALRGLLHAHMGWLFRHDQRGSRERYAPDLLADPAIRFVDRTFIVWALAGLAVPFGLGVAFGESWHNNHRAFPTSARHGLGRWQFDPSALVIRGLEACGLAWDVVRVPAERQRKAALPGRRESA